MTRRLTVALTISLAACGVAEPETTRSDKQRLTPQVPAAQLASAVHDNTEFALDLHRRIRADKPNIIASPHSVTSAVAMLWAGARTTSDSAIADALHFGAPQADLHPVFNHLDAQLAARNATVDDSDAFTLRVVNDLWAQKGFVLLPEYLDALALHYGAGVRRVDFAGDTDGARETINDWIAAQTEERIEELFPAGALDASTALALTNAVYFKADWLDAFEPSATALGPFHLADGSDAQVEFMHRTAPSRFVKTDQHIAVELPYKGEELALLVIVPQDLAAFEATLSAQDVEAIVGSLHSAEVQLALPKWTHEASFTLSATLGDMGMGELFSGDADLSGIDGKRDLYVQSVVHKAFIEVSEEGTEAAAATGISVGVTSIVDTVSVTIDRPFLYLLRDRATGAVVFLGRVGDPR